MDEALFQIFRALMVAYILAVVAAGIAMVRFIQHLKTNHLTTWERLGKPGDWVRNSEFEWIKVQPFIWRRRYAALGDPIATARGDMVRNFQIALLVGLIAILGCIFLANMSGRLTVG